MSKKDVAEMQVQRLLILGAISEEPAEAQERFRAALAEVKAAAHAQGDFALPAMTLAFIDLYLAAQEKS